MSTATPANPAERLPAIATTLLKSLAVEGVYARTGVYEDIVERLAAFISREREPDTEIFRFPPVMSRRQLEKSGYLKSFPHLLGCVSCLHGSEAEIRTVVDRFEAGGDWAAALA